MESILRWRRKDAEGKGGKYLEKENFLEAKSNGDVKRGKYLEKEKYSLWRGRRAEKEKEANIMETLHCRRKNLCGRVDRRTGRRLMKKSSRI